MALGNIIRKKREELKLTLDEVSRKVGFSKPYLSTVETGRVNNPPSDELLRKLEQVLGFEPGLLLHIAHVERLPSDIRKEYETSEAENKKLRNLIRQIIEKSSDKSKMNKMLKAEKVNIENVSESVSAGRFIPIINKVAAGYPRDFDDLDYPVGIADDYVRCPDIHDPNAFAVRVVGDSMEPKYREGDIVVFSPAVEVHNGDDCFVRFTSPHETTFKRVFFEEDDKVRLQPRNDSYAPTIVQGKRVNGLYRAIIKYERL
ncbi:MAG: XRE family transcriptional regulator [Phycisphaerae bacterium]|jgi:phage repressor protein C with HTH and peptisase S24 domain